MGMLYTLNSMFKLSICTIVYIFIVVCYQIVIVEFKYLESNNDAKKFKRSDGFL